MTPHQKLNLKELKSWCHEFLPLIEAKTLVFLNGPLGVGKTQWVKTLLHEMGHPLATSPTFSLINEYKEKGSALNVYHVDLYRIENESDLESTGFWDLFDDEKAVIFVEWSEKVSADFWPKDWAQYSLKIDFASDQNFRRYQFSRINN